MLLANGLKREHFVLEVVLAPRDLEQTLQYNYSLRVLTLHLQSLAHSVVGLHNSNR